MKRTAPRDQDSSSFSVIQPTLFQPGHYYFYTISLLRELEKICPATMLITADRIYLDSNIKEEIHERRASKYKSLTPAATYLSSCLRASWRFFRRRKSTSSLIILDTEYTVASLLIIALRLSGWSGKLVLQINAPNFSPRYSSGLFLYLKLIQKYLLKLSHQLKPFTISCLGDWHKEELASQLKIDPRHIVVIEDGDGFAYTCPSRVEACALLASEGMDFPTVLDGTQKIFLLFGNYRLDKGHLFLTRFWASLYHAKGDPILWVVGNDEDELIDLMPKSPNIYYNKGFVPFELISSIYALADFAILPYMKDYCGGAGPLMKGAFTHQVPAIVSNVADLQYMSNRRQLCYSFIPEDSRSLEQLVSSLVEMPEPTHHNQTQRALEYARARSWTELAKRFKSCVD